MDKASGLAVPNDLARRIGLRFDELSRAAVGLGCDDSTVAALKGASALMPDIANGRASLSNPATWTEARWQANQIFQSESIAGIPLHRAWAVALDKLERAAKERQVAGSGALARPTPAEDLSAQTNPTHSEDFVFVKWFGTEYTFALGVQTSAVRALWDEWERTGLGLHQETIGNIVDAERSSFRMDTAFRKHPAFGKMIQRCGDGKYRLAAPTTSAAATVSKSKESARIRRNHA